MVDWISTAAFETKRTFNFYCIFILLILNTKNEFIAQSHHNVLFFFVPERYHDYWLDTWWPGPLYSAPTTWSHPRVHVKYLLLAQHAIRLRVKGQGHKSNKPDASYLVNGQSHHHQCSVRRGLLLHIQQADEPLNAKDSQLQNGKS